MLVIDSEDKTLKMSNDTSTNDDSAKLFEKGDDVELPLWYGSPEKDIFRAEHWIASVERARTIYKWNNGTFVQHVRAALRDRALTWFNMLERNGVVCNNWDQVKEKFLKVYGTPDQCAAGKFKKGNLFENLKTPILSNLNTIQL